MQIYCTRCNRVVGRIPDSRIPAQGGKVACPSCQGTIQVRPANPVQQVAASHPAGGQTERRDNSPAEQPVDSSLALEVTWARALKIWWSYAWRCLLFSLAAAFALGFVGGLLLALVGLAELGPIVGRVLGNLAGIMVSIIVLKVVLQKRFQDFTIKLVPAGKQ